MGVGRLVGSSGPTVGRSMEPEASFETYRCRVEYCFEQASLKLSQPGNIGCIPT